MKGFRKPQGQRSSDLPIPNPNLANRGLSSTRNQNYVLAVLAKSSREEVRHLLEMAQYRPPPESNISQKDKEQALQQELEGWVRSDEGRDHLDAMKRRCLGAEIGKDSDIFKAACRKEIQRKVDCWLQSPGGQEAVEQARQRAVRGRVESVVK